MPLPEASPASPPSPHRQAVLYATIAEANSTRIVTNRTLPAVWPSSLISRPNRRWYEERLDEPPWAPSAWPEERIRQTALAFSTASRPARWYGYRPVPTRTSQIRQSPTLRPDSPHMSALDAARRQPGGVHNIVHSHLPLKRPVPQRGDVRDAIRRWEGFVGSGVFLEELAVPVSKDGRTLEQELDDVAVDSEDRELLAGWKVGRGVYEEVGRGIKEEGENGVEERIEESTEGKGDDGDVDEEDVSSTIVEIGGSADEGISNEVEETMKRMEEGKVAHKLDVEEDLSHEIAYRPRHSVSKGRGRISDGNEGSESRRDSAC